MSGAHEGSQLQSELEITLGLSKDEYGMILSADQNGFMHPVNERERATCERLVGEGIFFWSDPQRRTEAKNTPQMTAILEERERVHREARK